MTEKEKDAFIVQLRGEVTRYRDAYRLAKYQLDQALKELQDKHSYGYKFDDKRTRCREATMQGNLRKLREELDKLKVEG